MTEHVPAEDGILSDVVRPGMRVLDVGCGSGRSARKLRALTPDVWAVDVDERAVRRLEAGIGRTLGIESAVADMRHLPFPDGHFDLVLVAGCGMDYLLARSDRGRALRELGRVLKDGGVFVLSSHNRIGILLSPRASTSPRYLRWRLRHVLHGRIVTRTFVDLKGIGLYQALPSSVIEEVIVSEGGMRFVYATNEGGTTRSLALLTLFSARPYFVFERTAR